MRKIEFRGEIVSGTDSLAAKSKRPATFEITLEGPQFEELAEIIRSIG
jgi:hypothetical protein